MCGRAFGLNPTLDIRQYAHTAWSIQDGALKSRVQSIAQTPDGYLWLGTEFGLLRFDGVRFTPWVPPGGQLLPSRYVSKLLVSRDGSVWIGMFQGLASWNGTALRQFPEFERQYVNSLLEDRDGAMWVGTSGFGGKLCTIQNAKVQ